MSSIPQEERHTRGVDLRSNFQRLHGHVGTFLSHYGETISVKERRPIIISCASQRSTEIPLTYYGSFFDCHAYQVAPTQRGRVSRAWPRDGRAQEVTPLLGRVQGCTNTGASLAKAK